MVEEEEDEDRERDRERERDRQREGVCYLFTGQRTIYLCVCIMHLICDM